MSNGRSNSSQTHAHWSVTIYEVAFEFISYTTMLSRDVSSSGYD